MMIREFLRGPLPDDALKELEAGYGGPLTRHYVVGFKERYVNPDGRAEEVLSRFGLLARNGGVRPCIAGYGIVGGRWYGPPAPAVGRYVDVASSDAIFVGVPRGCRAAEAKPAVMDMVRLDVDLPAPRFIVKRVDGRVQVVDRASGVVLKEFPREKYSARAAAKALKVPVGEIRRAEMWGEDGAAPAAAILMRTRRIAERAARKKLDVRFMLSGAKGFHVLLTLERPAPAQWRPAVVKKLAEWLDIDADPAAFDPAHKLRTPWTVHTETGRLAVFVDPKTLEPIEFDWPKPIPYELVKTLAALGLARLGLPRPRWPEAAKPRRAGWVPYLEALAAANPGLREDCRKRFSALFGCGCAVDGLSVEACAARLAAALSLGETLNRYLPAMERAYKTCAERAAEGQKPLFSIKKALSADVGEGGGKVWYSIRECITAKPPAPGAVAAPSGTPPAAELAAEVSADTQQEEAVPAEEEPGQAVAPQASGGGEEQEWEELERFIREHLSEGPAAGAEQRTPRATSEIKRMTLPEILDALKDILGDDEH